MHADVRRRSSALIGVHRRSPTLCGMRSDRYEVGLRPRAYLNNFMAECRFGTLVFDFDGGERVRYMLLVHHDEESFRKRADAERQHMLQESVQLAQQLDASGQYRDA